MPTGATKTRSLIQSSPSRLRISGPRGDIAEAQCRLRTRVVRCIRRESRRFSFFSFLFFYPPWEDFYLLVSKRRIDICIYADLLVSKRRKGATWRRSRIGTGAWRRLVSDQATTSALALILTPAAGGSAPTDPGFNTTHYCGNEPGLKVSPWEWRHTRPSSYTSVGPWVGIKIHHIISYE